MTSTHQHRFHPVTTDPGRRDRDRELVHYLGMLAWREASWVRRVRYLCEPGPTDRAVRGAVAKAQVGAKVKVYRVPR